LASCIYHKLRPLEMAESKEEEEELAAVAAAVARAVAL
jgi:hypothetical protein